MARWWLLFFWGVGIGSVALHGQVTYKMDVYTSREGLPQNSVRGLAFDCHGFLWLSTEGGVARFDGSRFKLVGTDTHPELEGQRFSRLEQLPDSSILFEDQFYRLFLWKENRFFESHAYDPENPALAPELFPAGVGVFEAVQRNKLWAYWHKGLFPISRRYSFMHAPQGNTIVLLDHHTGVHRPVDYKIEGLFKVVAYPNRVLVLDWQKKQLLALDTLGARLVPCRVVDENRQPCSFPSDNLRMLPDYGSGQIFVFDGRSLFTLEPSGTTYTYVLKKLPVWIPENCAVYVVANRPEAGLIAVGTETQGLLIYRKQHFKSIRINSTKNVLKNAQYAQALLNDQTLLTSYGDLIDVASGKVGGRFPFPFNSYYLFSQPQKKLYFTERGNSFLLNLNNSQARPKALNRYTLFRCFAAYKDTIWVCTNKGLSFLDSDSLVYVYQRDFAYTKALKSMCHDDYGGVWFSNLDQLYRYDRGSGTLDSFPQLQGADVRAINCIRGNIYIGTYGRGYFVYRNGQISSMPLGAGKEFLHTHAFILDPKGFVWITTNRGLYRTHVDALEQHLQDNTRGIYFNAYLEEDGISSSEFNGGCYPTSLWLPGGRLSLPTMDGLVWFDPLAVPERFSRDTILLEGFQQDQNSYLLNKPILLPANHSTISIQFATPWWDQPYNRKIQYKLTGYHEAFRPVRDGQQQLSFDHLSPGTYTLVLQKRIGYRPEDVVETTLTFTVDAPWFLRPWAFVLYGLAFLLVLWLSSYLYAYSIRQSNISLQKKVDRQTRALQESNLHLAQNLRKLERSESELRTSVLARDRLISVLSHDILTPLRYISLIARMSAQDEQHDAHRARQSLLDVRNAAEKLFHSTQNVLNWVKYQQQGFKVSPSNCSPYALTEQLLNDFSEMARYQGNTLINEVPEDDVIRTDPQILSIVLHNLLSNAVKFTQNGRIWVRSGVENNHYVIEVADTGRGMTADQLLNVRQGTAAPSGESSGNGIGLSLVAELVQALDGHWDIESPGGVGVRVRMYLNLTVPVAP